MKWLSLFLLLGLVSAAYGQRYTTSLQHVRYVQVQELENSLSFTLKKTAVIFSDRSCFWTPIPDRNCMVLEQQLDKKYDAIVELGWELVAIDVGSTPVDLSLLYGFRSRPSVVLFDRGAPIRTIEKFEKDIGPLSFPWYEEMAMRVLAAMRSY